MSVQWKEFGYTRGYRCYLVTLRNRSGYSAAFTNYGAAVQSLCVPDTKGNFGDVVLGYDTLEEYIKGDSCFGATIGRFANRIGGAKFTLGGKEYKLFDNNNGNTLHGGEFGYHRRVWTLDCLRDGQEPYVVFKYISPDGEEHFPGTLSVKVRYTLLQNGLRIDYTAVSDADTVINLTNHSYFNLKGAGDGNVLNHKVQLSAKEYTPVDENLIPVGNPAYTIDTPFDFSRPKKIGTDMENGRLPGGYDHNFILKNDGLMNVAARVYEPHSRRFMTVRTDMPAMQMYIGIGLDNEPGKNGAVYEKFGGLCLETQFCPDSPNKPQFPGCVLSAGEEFSSATEYIFDVK